MARRRSYAYPPVVYPPGYAVATAAVSFGVGVMMGAMFSGCCGHGGYGWGCGWGGNNTVVVNNNFNTRYGYNNIQGGNNINNIQGGNRNNVGNGNSWQHNPSHRGAVPYNNAGTAQRFGGTSKDGQRFDRGGQPRANDRSNDRGNDRGDDRGGSGNRDAGRDQSRGGQDRGGQGGQDRVGSRDVGSSKGRDSGLGGTESRQKTQAASDRGFSSSRSSGGGGGGGASTRSTSRSGGGGGGASRGAGRRSPALEEIHSHDPEIDSRDDRRCGDPDGADHGPQDVCVRGRGTEALVKAAAQGMDAIKAMFGPGSAEILRTGDRVEDRAVVERFRRLSAEKTKLEADPMNPDRVTLLIGTIEWPMAVPLVRKGGRWSFDIQGRQGGDSAARHRRSMSSTPSRSAAAMWRPSRHTPSRTGTATG